MRITKVEFVKSSANISQLPKLSIPEYAFIGRSNVGKSSLINMLAKTNVAKISKTPGKTKLINHFLINDSWLLADLPGYGYASVSKETRATWLPLIRNYLTKRENLYSIMLLVDSRLQPQSIDLEFLEFIGINQLPFVIVFTKADKLGSTALNKNIDIYKRKLLERWEFLPETFITSSKSKKGAEALLQFISNTNTR